MKNSLLMVLLAALVIVSCDEDDNSTNVDPDAVVLSGYGPLPTYRDSTLIFVGRNLDEISSIVLPGDMEITDFSEHSETRIELTVPETDFEGEVVLNYADGTITPLAKYLRIEPITITDLSHSTIKPGAELTISGTYLNRVEEVIFTTGVVVEADDFVSHSEGTIVVEVPAEARTGTIIVSDGVEEKPETFTTADQLEIVMPTITSFDPVNVKPGNELTIVGTDLDLAKSVVIPGMSAIAEFTVNDAGTELTLETSATVTIGTAQINLASGLNVVSTAEIALVRPTITGMPDSEVKNSSTMEIDGTNLDLITAVWFQTSGEEGSQGSIDAQSADQLTIGIPADAVENTVTLVTADGHEVISGSVISLAEPVVTDITPSSVNTVDSPIVTVTGTDLDVVVAVEFTAIENSGDVWSIEVDSPGETSFSVDVVPGAVSGAITLVTSNGSRITTSQTIDITPNLPTDIGGDVTVEIGKFLTLTGTDMDIPMNLFFPTANGFAQATLFGEKSASSIEVFVPTGFSIATGIQQVKFVTFDNEVTYSHDILFQQKGADPVDDPDLVFFDFDGKGSWWGSGSVTTDLANSADGTNFVHISGNKQGWDGLFFRNGGDIHGISTVGTDVDDYELWVDIKVNAPITDGNIKFRLSTASNATDYWFGYGPASRVNNGEVIPVSETWYTIKIPISDFRDEGGWGSGTITDANDIQGDFGAAWNDGTVSTAVDVYMDNLRWQYVGP